MPPLDVCVHVALLVKALVAEGAAEHRLFPALEFEVVVEATFVVVLVTALRTH